MRKSKSTSPTRSSFFFWGVVAFLATTLWSRRTQSKAASSSRFSKVDERLRTLLKEEDEKQSEFPKAIDMAPISE